ncbi:uncharacterized protein LOC120181533 [Hibiscus syriacus]|uniref:uncharacterized protein LOC120181533 n=1 Tax=Hibiscus syriacus TaxID=106335 RepID=UPI00192374A3|nr:uncharacterized protein LOC120181533 [Hibiscus syriacus]
MQLYPLQCKLLSLTYLLLASTYRQELLILWVRLSMRLTSSHSKVYSITVPLKLLRLVVSSVLSPCFLLPLVLHFLFSLVCGFMVNFSVSPRKLRGLQRWKSGLGLPMPQWTNGFSL